MLESLLEDDANGGVLGSLGVLGGFMFLARQFLLDHVNYEMGRGWG